VEARPFHHRYVLLLALILATVIFDLAAPDGDGARLIAVVLQAATLVAAVVTSRAHPWVVRMTIAACILLVAAAAGAVLGTENFGGDSARLISLLLVALAPPVIVLGLRQHYREAGGTSLQTMFGVLCIYLLLGLLFGTLFGAIQSLSEESFFTNDDERSTSDFLYFSFATLTTVGYGDLVAATNLGRSLAIAEALIGQIYLVTVVALIVAGLSPTRLRRDPQL
jgi:voltage-gated potassium channel